MSVSDKTGLVDFARALHAEFHIELVSTGGTAAALRHAGLPVVDVSTLTGFPEMMDGRIKTLHPRIHGGLLALRDRPEHIDAMERHGILPIDLVCVNLYPFANTIAKPGVTLPEAIENIDIGGPSMIRSAAKNHRFVLVVTGPDRYEKILGDLREHNGSSCGKHRLKQAQRAFALCAEYDATIARYLQTQIDSPTAGAASVPPAASASPGAPADATSLPETFSINVHRAQALRYGENPHQKAALYVGNKPAEASVAFAKQLHGKELSYINLLDADAAMALVREFKEPAACVIKHMTPCGCAIAHDPATAFVRAFEGDPLAAFGGIVAVNRAIDSVTAEVIAAVDKLLEVIVAPAFDPAARERLATRWKNVRLLEVGPLDRIDPAEIHMHKIVGGYLIQERDLAGADTASWTLASTRAPTDAERTDLRFAWLVCKYVKSNAVVVARDGMLLGAGAGQMDRMTAAKLAIEKAGRRARGAVAASDAFFPFPDGPELLLNAGIDAIVQPGGSMNDAASIAAVNRHEAAMVFTGRRHFKH